MGKSDSTVAHRVWSDFRYSERFANAKTVLVSAVMLNLDPSEPVIREAQRIVDKEKELYALYESSLATRTGYYGGTYMVETAKGEMRALEIDD